MTGTKEQMTEQGFFATGGPVDEILLSRGIPKYGELGREAMLDGWFNASTDHNFDAQATAEAILDEIEQAKLMRIDGSDDED